MPIVGSAYAAAVVQQCTCFAAIHGVAYHGRRSTTMGSIKDIFDSVFDSSSDIAGAFVNAIDDVFGAATGSLGN